MSSSALTWQTEIRRRLSISPIAGPLLTLIAAFVLFSILVPHFFTVRTMAGIVNAATLTGVVTIGVTMLMISGEFDLSVGALMAMGGFLYGMGTLSEDPLMGPFLIVLALLVPMALGALNGLILIRTGVPSFIVTLATGSIFRGAVWLLSQGSMLQTIEKFVIFDVFNGRLDFIADAIKGANFRTSTLWWLFLVMVFEYVMVRTPYGNHVFATGGNPGAAQAQGVNVKRVKVINFMISGALAGLAGILLFSQFKTVRVATGVGTELNAIAAAVVGGTALTGGVGSIVGGLLGVLIISMLRTGVVLTDLIPADNFEAIVGVTIIAAAMFNNWLRGRA
jgi:simple sugar transport system permease protein